MIDTDTLLKAISATGPTDFKDLCDGLRGCMPSRDNKSAWRDFWRAVWQQLEEMERAGFVEVIRKENRFESAILTESGADRIREKLDKARPLFGAL